MMNNTKGLIKVKLLLVDFSFNLKLKYDTITESLIDEFKNYGPYIRVEWITKQVAYESGIRMR